MKQSGSARWLVVVAIAVAVFVTVQIFLTTGVGTSDVTVEDTRDQPGATVYPAARAAIIERVVDGDTVVVRLDGTSSRVRLLNIDTPESVDPDRDVECLGPEASAYLTGLLPQGTAVTLEFDVEPRDQYDRLLAGIVTADGTLVNAQIARSGFAELVVFGANDRFELDIQAAVTDAKNSRAGLWAEPPAC